MIDVLFLFGRSQYFKITFPIKLWDKGITFYTHYYNYSFGTTTRMCIYKKWHIKLDSIVEFLLLLVFSFTFLINRFQKTYMFIFHWIKYYKKYWQMGRKFLLPTSRYGMLISHWKGKTNLLASASAKFVIRCHFCFCFNYKQNRKY